MASRHGMVVAWWHGSSKAEQHNDAWHTWYVDDVNDAIATGSSTSYKVVDGDVADDSGLAFQFVTIRLSGHEVPAYNARAAYSLFEKFVGEEVF